MTELYYSEIKDYVKAQLDELSNSSDALIVGSDKYADDLDRIIESVIIPSVRKIHLEAPNILLKDGKSFGRLTVVPVPIYDYDELEVSPLMLEFEPQGGDKIVMVRSSSEWCITEGGTRGSQATGTYVVNVSLPNDFMRLITIKLVGWDTPIETLAGEDSAEARMQKNKYMRGTPRRPAGVLMHNVSGDPIAALYTCKSNSQASIDYAQYVPEPRRIKGIDGNEYTEICGTLRYSCLNQITSAVLRTIGKAQESASYEAMAVRPFSVDPDWMRMNPQAGERIIDSRKLNT